MGSGEGKCKLDRSGREPPVFRAEGTWGVLDCWSGEGKILWVEGGLENTGLRLQGRDRLLFKSWTVQYVLVSVRTKSDGGPDTETEM